MGSLLRLLCLLPLLVVVRAGHLFPRESESREVKSLDGFWDFLVPPPSTTHQEHDDVPKSGLASSTGKMLKMPVPSSYNDITVEADLRDYVGTVWYERTFFVPKSWQSQRVYLRFGSVHYYAAVYVNGEFAVEHEGGHLPFEAEVSSLIDFGKSNRLTVSVNNVLTNVTVPQGVVELTYGSDPQPREVQTYTFDFFNYAGIHRPVVLYTVPNTHILDINVTSSINELQNSYDAAITYAIEVDGNDAVECRITLVDGDGVIRVFQQAGCEGVLLVPNATLWWPIFMDKNPGHLYLFEVELLSTSGGEVVDKYRLPVGVRTVTMQGTSLLINGKPIYIRGVGKHEDADIRGKGLDLPIMSRDIELMKWMGVNCYRTSHYPYSEESMQMADKEGFMVIDEAPSVNTEFYSDELKLKHEKVLSELIRRDKNYASAIMWSLANEPRTQHNNSEPYFRYLRDSVREMDPTRPITIVIAQPYTKDRAGHLCDVLLFNRYNAWYSNDGRLETIAPAVVSEARSWFEAYGKPVVMAEYGGDTMAGLHRLPAFIWSEEFQSDLLSEHFKAFDLLRSEGIFIGEMIWNFADFMTNQDYTRVGGNKKGVFTRDKQPKEGAFILRQRYLELAHELDHAPKPKKRYIRVPKHIIDEL